MSRLRKQAGMDSDSAADLVRFMDELLKKTLASEAQKIGFDYDDSVYELETNHPKYEQIVQKLLEAGSLIDELSEEWATETQNNYGDMLNHE